MADKEEDITIDLSKIASFFKAKGKGEKSAGKADKTPEPKGKEEPQEQEISLDFSKITSLFRAKPQKTQEAKRESKASAEPREDEAEFSLDLTRIKEFFAGVNKTHLLLLLVIIPIILGVYIRMQTMDLHITDTWARDSVNNYYKNAILDQISQQYPNLPDSKKQELLSSEFSVFLKEQGAMVEQQVAGLSQQFKQEYKNDQGYNYMPDIDTYYWLRFIENMDKHGQPGDILVNGKPFDNHFLAPLGREISLGEYFPIYTGYYFYKLLHFFNKNLSPMTAFSYLPVFLFVLSAIFIFMIGRRIAGDIGGLFAGLMLAVTPYFVTKTAFGFADTDMYSVFFPILITWLFFEGFESDKLWKTSIFSAVAGLFVGVFSLAWGGWMYIFDFLIGTTGIYILYYTIINRTKLAMPKIRFTLIELVAVIALFFTFSLLSVSLFINFESFTMAFSAPLRFIYIKSVSLSSIWPNVYTTVAEQGVVPLSDLITKMGGNFLFILSIIGILLTALKRDRNNHFELKYVLLLSMWFLSTLYASTKGMRWMLLLVPAFCVAFGAFVGMAVQFLSDFTVKEFKIGKGAATLVLIILFGLLLIMPANTAIQITQSQVPDINEAWVRTLTEIKTNSSQEAIINSWWDFGHWFKYWADRKVTFDGTSQNIAQAHWIGEVLLTGSEDEAIGILRMLDCKANTAYETLAPILNSSLDTISMVKQIILLNKEEAKKLLISKGFSPEKTDEILSYTHCQPPEDYFITSEDMVSKSGVWAHFGGWDFTRSEMVLTVKSKDPAEGKKILQERFLLSPAQAEKYYYEIQTIDPNQWISPWPSYLSSLSACTKAGELVSCGNGIIFNLTSEDAYADTSQGRLYPKSFSFINKGGKFTSKGYDASFLVATDGQPIGVSLILKGGNYVSILMTPVLTTSMFTRLFYFNGYGLEHFKPFYSDRDFTGFEIYVWKVDWPK